MKKSSIQILMTIFALTLLLACTTTIDNEINKGDIAEINLLVNKKYDIHKAEFILRKLNNEVSFYDSVFKLSPDMVMPTFRERIATLSMKYDMEQKQKIANKEKQKEATRKAEISNKSISEIPLGFRFRMSKKDVSNLLDELQRKNIISHNGYDYIYFYNTIKGEKIKLRLDFRYFEDELKTLYFHLYGYTIGSDDKQYENESERALEIDLTEKLDSTYNKISYYETFDGENVPVTKWFKNNQIVTLRNYIGVFLSYENAPIAKIYLDKQIKELRRSRTTSGNVEVINSSYDGSVSQVVDYLKKNLKDPKSYEGIEWSEVKKTADGYVVRHKYRAKNSFGGYVVENQIFYLNNNGEVISELNNN